MSVSSCLSDMPFYSISNIELSGVLFGKSKVMKDDVCNDRFLNNILSVCNNSILK